MATRKARPGKAVPKPKKSAAKKPAKKAAPARRARKPAKKADRAEPAARKSVEPAAQIALEPPDPSDQTQAIVANVVALTPQPEEPAPEEEAEQPAEPPPEEEPDDGGEVVRFEGVLTPHQPAGTYVPLTREQSERFPGAGIVHVKGTVGGVPIQSSLMPMGDGTRSLGVHKATLEQGGFTIGDTVKVAIRLDTAPREVVVPRDFADALEKSPKARKTFANYAFTHRKEYVNWIEEAKQPETRQRRIDQAVRMIEANEKLS